MGKVSRVHRSRLRMTSYNIEKSNKQRDSQQNIIKHLEDSISQIKQENHEMKHKIYKLESSSNISLIKQHVNQALLAQKQRYNTKHESVVKLLQERYKIKLDILSESHQSQIEDLTSKLKSISEELSKAKKSLLTSNIRKPNFSPGRYNGIPP